MKNNTRNTIISGLAALTIGLSGCGDNNSKEGKQEVYDKQGNSIEYIEKAGIQKEQVIYDAKNPSIKGEFPKEFKNKMGKYKEYEIYFYNGRIIHESNFDDVFYELTSGKIIQINNNKIHIEAGDGINIIYNPRNNTAKLIEKRGSSEYEQIYSLKDTPTTEKQKLDKYLSKKNN